MSRFDSKKETKFEISYLGDGDYWVYNHNTEEKGVVDAETAVRDLKRWMERVEL